MKVSFQRLRFILHLTSWLYARRGDPSDEFRFATFFPAALHPIIDTVAGLCSQVFRVGLQQAAVRAESGSSMGLSGAPLPGSDNAEAARRRYTLLFTSLLVLTKISLGDCLSLHADTLKTKLCLHFGQSFVLLSSSSALNDSRTGIKTSLFRTVTFQHVSCRMASCTKSNCSK